MATLNITLGALSYSKEIPDGALQRIRNAFREQFKNPGDAPLLDGSSPPAAPMTANEVWEAIGNEFVRHLRDVVRRAELKAAEEAAHASVTPIV